MERELAGLQRRVAELEAALAMGSKRTDRPNLRRWVALMPLMCAGVLILCVGILLGGSTGLSAAPPIVPTKVVQPFEVVDSTGRVLFRVAMGSGGVGLVEVMDAKGSARVTIGAEPGGPFGTIQVVEGSIRFVAANGSLKAALGISAEDDGLVLLHGKTGTSLALDGKGILDMLNAPKKKVVGLGVSGFGGGDLHLYNNNGTSVVGIFSEQGQTGIAQFFDAAGRERVTLGTKTTGKGDVCVSGDKGQLCLGRLSPNY